eukprot:Hpha_TRINITY_DN16253_c1_g5::TRINITY_DN16253_c1_g5_i1::g.12164::m.12164/K01025/SULT1; sulfotransferase
MARCCSARSLRAALIVVQFLLAAALPTLMAALLRYMFTAPGQVPWPRGRLRLINVSGLPAQPLNSAERIVELAESFEHRKGDVWVVSYVKSGTTWTIGIVASLYGHPAAHYAGHLQKTTYNFAPQPELPDLGWGSDGFGHSIAALNAWPSPRCFKSHWPSRDHVAANGKSRFIYVMRNAQDQITSHWNQVWGMGFHYGTENLTLDGGWDGFFEDWLAGDVENGSWFDHIASWWARREDPDVLIVRYEELKADPAAGIRRIAAFVGVEADEAKVTETVELTSFQKMREADQADVGLYFLRSLGVLRTTHIRSGVAGSGAGRFSAAQLRALEREYDRKLKPLGVPKEYVLHGGEKEGRCGEEEGEE